MPTYSNLVVIGNGFDLNLGLKTSYADFANSQQFMSLLKNRNSMAEDLHNRFKQVNWIDIENELKTYSTNDSYTDNMEVEFEALREALMNYLQTIDISLMDTNSIAYTMMAAVLKTQCMILDFNYTGTVKYIMQKLGLHASKIQQQLIHVHGSIEKRDIIFGVEDGARIDLKNHIFLKKSSNRNFNGMDITDFLQPHTYLHIFGHSLGESDRTYFQPYFDWTLNNTTAAKRSVSLYHYGQTSWNRLMYQIDDMTRQKTNIYKQKIQLIPINTYLVQANN